MVPQKQMSFDLSPTITRKELPSCEAIDVRKVNIGSSAKAITKFKAGINLKVHTEFKIGTNFKTGTDLKQTWKKLLIVLKRKIQSFTMSSK